MKIPEHMLLVDKPEGITSFDVIRHLRKDTRFDALRDVKGRVKMGHAGTLDPLATGLILLGVGPGTKKLTEYVGLSKVYEAEVVLGVRTTTGDREGEVLEEMDVASVDREQVEEMLLRMVGVLTLLVPRYAAVKQGGVPLYKKARRGEELVVPRREMEVMWIKLHAISCEAGRCVLTIELEVSSGTYIRSIAEEIGEKLGVPGSLKTLRRTRIGNFSIADAEKLEGDWTYLMKRHRHK